MTTEQKKRLTDGIMDEYVKVLSARARPSEEWITLSALDPAERELLILRVQELMTQELQDEELSDTLRKHKVSTSEVDYPELFLAYLKSIVASQVVKQSGL